MSRKAFLRLSGWFTVAAFAVVWRMLTSKQNRLIEKPIQMRVQTAKIGAGIYFYDKFILVKSSSSVKVFSNRCTHAGCKITHQIDNQLICPCHGSRFDASNGKVLQGPALKPLNALVVDSNADSGEIILII